MFVGNRRVKEVKLPTDKFVIFAFSRHGFSHQETIVRNIPNKRMPIKNSPSNIVWANLHNDARRKYRYLSKNGSDMSVGQIILSSVTKKFGDTVAVDDVSLQIEGWRVFLLTWTERVRKNNNITYYRRVCPSDGR